MGLLEEKELRGKAAYPERKGKVVRRALSTERNILPIELDGAFKVIGERINPTGKKALQAQLREGSLELVGEMAEAQVEAGAAGKIFKVEASVGQAVKKGDAVIILEAMKMEIPVVAPQDGTVASIDVAVGDAIDSGAVLATLN